MELRTRYGKLSGCSNVEYDTDGWVKGCCFEEENKIPLECGTLIPHYGEENVRTKFTQTAAFYPNGALRRIALENQTEVQTPIGPFPAELLTFYENGAIQRIFPLNGKLSGYWSERDESNLAVPFRFKFYFGSFSAKIISIHFYENGNIQSITLFPGEEISILTPVGTIPVRTGFSLYDNGTLKSAEPSRPVSIPTRIGKINAFDTGMIGIHADTNSLQFSETGEVTGITTSNQEIVVQREGQPLERIAPIVKPSPLDENEVITIPITIQFEENTVVLTNETKHVYAVESSAFTILQSQDSACPSCTDCSICGKCAFPPYG